MLAGIKFDDSLLVGNGLNFLTSRDTHNYALELILGEGQPIRHGAACGTFEALRCELAGDVVILNGDYVIHTQGE